MSENMKPDLQPSVLPYLSRNTFVIIALLLLVVRYVTLLVTDLTLHGDEAQYWTWSRTFEFGYYSKPPLIAWVIGLFTSVCSDATWCVRAPSSLFHLGTAIALCQTATTLFNRQVGLWTALAWLTIPAVSYSSLLMSTDALLLFFWSLSLLGYVRLVNRPNIGNAALLTLGFGLGLNAKYAMAYFLLCLILHLVLSGQARQRAKSALVYLLPSLLIGAAMILPNVYWNAANGWATMGHTADNAHWQGLTLHFDKMFEFLGAQFGVFGPVFLAILLIAIPFLWKRKQEASDKVVILLSFSLPILTIITVQGLLSRANANWAATTYPAATILVVYLLSLTKLRFKLLIGSIAFHTAVALTLYIGVANPTRVAEALGRDPFKDLSGWEGVRDQVIQEMQDKDLNILLMDNRMMLASMAYQLRDHDITIRAWNHDVKIDHHYEMAWLYDPQVNGNRVLLLTPHDVEPFAAQFDITEDLDDIQRMDRAGRAHILKQQILEFTP